MGVMISAAFAMSVVAQPGLAHAVDVDPSGLVEGGEEHAANPTPPPAYVIIDIPEVNRERLQDPLSGPSVDDFDLRDTLPALRQDPAAAAHAAQVMRPEPEVADAGADDIASEDEDRFNAAVVKAHDERIWLIKRQIDQLKDKQTAPSDAALLNLTNRLKRAEDARLIAASRTGSPVSREQMVAARSTGEHESAERRAPLPASRLPDRITVEPLVRDGVAGERKPAEALARKKPPLVAPRDAGPQITTPIGLAAAAIVVPAEPPASRNDPAVALHHARKKLTEARQMLDDRAPVSAKNAYPLDISWSSPAGQLALALSALLLVCAVAQTRHNAVPVSA